MPNCCLQQIQMIRQSPNITNRCAKLDPKLARHFYLLSLSLRALIKIMLTAYLTMLVWRGFHPGYGGCGQWHHTNSLTKLKKRLPSGRQQVPELGCDYLMKPQRQCALRFKAPM